MTDYGGYVSRSNGRLSEDEALCLVMNSKYGSDAYPIRKCGSKWTWGPINEIQAPSTVFATKRAATTHYENFLAMLRDKLAGRITGMSRSKEN